MRLAILNFHELSASFVLNFIGEYSNTKLFLLGWKLFFAVIIDHDYC